MAQSADTKVCRVWYLPIKWCMTTLPVPFSTASLALLVAYLLPTLPNQTLSFTSTYARTLLQEVGKMHAITMLINNATGEIVNAEQTAVPFTIIATTSLQKKQLQ